MTDGRPDAPLLSVRDVARLYGVDEWTIRRWIRKGIIGYVEVGPFRVKRIPPDEAEKHFKKRDGVE